MQIIHGLVAVSMLPPVDAANTAAATSSFIDVRGYVGLLRVILFAGILDAGTLDWTFNDATDAGGTGSAAIVPASGALTQVTTSNDNPNIQTAIFDANSTRGFLQCVGTIVTGGALVAAVLEGLPANT